MWSFHISRLIEAKLKTTKLTNGAFVQDTTGRMRLSLTRQFEREKPRILDDLLRRKLKSLPMYYTCSDGAHVAITLSPDELSQCFSTGFLDPINLAKTKISELCSHDKTRSLGVIVSGGSLNNPEIMSILVDAMPPSLEGRIRFSSSTGVSYL